MKFRQFKSAVCDAFGVILFFEKFARVLLVFLGGLRGMW